MSPQNLPGVTPPRPARARRRRHLGKLGLAVLVLLALAGAGLYYLWHLQDQELLREIARTDQLDPGWRLEELETKRKIIPDEQNSALTVQAVYQLLPKQWPALAKPPDLYLPGRVSGLPPEVQLDPVLTQELQTELGKLQKAREVAAKLNNQPAGRFTIDWATNPIATLVPHIDQINKIAKLFDLEAALVSQQGQPDLALAAIRRLLATERSIGNEPSGISQLVRVARRGEAVRCLERAFAQGQPSPGALAETQVWFQEEAAQPLVLNAFRGERAICHRLLVHLRSGQETRDSTSPNSLTARLEVLSTVYQVRGALPQVLRYTSECVEIAKKPIEQQKELLDQMVNFAENPGSRLSIWVRRLIPGICKLGQAFPRDLAFLRCAVTALAAERFRRDRGRWPIRLDDLVPAYLDKVPLDPYDGQPLRYRSVADGVLIYSVGPDERDNGGACNREDIKAPGTDLVFRLWNPPKRRQPAAELLPKPDEVFLPE